MIFYEPFCGLEQNTDLLLMVLDKELFQLEKEYRKRFGHALERTDMTIYDQYSFYDGYSQACGECGTIRRRSSDLKMRCSTEKSGGNIVIDFDIAAKILEQSFVLYSSSFVSPKTLSRQFMQRFGSAVISQASDMHLVLIPANDLRSIIDKLILTCLNIFPMNEKYHDYSSILPELEFEEIRSHKNEKSRTQKKSSRKNQKKWRDQVVERDKKCQCCGFTKHLEAHHIFSYRDYEEYQDDPNNGITLCRFCHKKYHSQYGRDGANPKDLLEFLQTYQVNRD